MCRKGAWPELLIPAVWRGFIYLAGASAEPSWILETYQTKKMTPIPTFDLTNCMLCPRNCGANRAAGQVGYCRVPAQLIAARAGLLQYEEPCLIGSKGSGAVFFSGCNMGCIFCQNHEISGTDPGAALPPGKEITAQELSQAFLRLQEQGAANINLVTPTHYLHQILPALETARRDGLSIPVVYNTSAYEKVEMLRLLDGLVDIYLPDLKYCSEALAVEYSRAPHYFETASAAIAEMVRQCPEPVLDADGQMQRGVIVRHLALPGQAEDSRRILRYLYETYGDQIYISILNQYTPMPAVKKHPLLSRTLTEEEYDQLVDYALALGVENGFIQEGGTASESFIPVFDGTGL